MAFLLLLDQGENLVFHLVGTSRYTSFNSSHECSTSYLVYIVFHTLIQKQLNRSSFRSGAPPPPRPIKQFYDKLFWFGFDPDVTSPTDRTMFGGTRGKFNALDLLSDREERQRMRHDYDDYRGYDDGDGRMRRRRGNSGSRRTGTRDPIIQDFGNVRDWDARKNGQGRTGGDAVGDDNDRPYYGYDAAVSNGDVMDDDIGPVLPFPGDIPPPMGMPEYDFDVGLFETQRRRNRGGRRRRRDSRRRQLDRRAEEYDRFLGLGPMSDVIDEEEYIDELSSPRRRRGFAYKYNGIDLLEDDGEYIDVEPKYATSRDLNMARRPNERRRRRQLSIAERDIELDRVPPGQNAVPWGPNGRIESEDGEFSNPLDVAAMEALRDIQRSKRVLERKEQDVEDAKEVVLSLKE